MTEELQCPLCGKTTGLNKEPFKDKRSLGAHIGRAHTHMLKAVVKPEFRLSSLAEGNPGPTTIKIVAQTKGGYLGFDEKERAWVSYPATVRAHRTRVK